MDKAVTVPGSMEGRGTYFATEQRLQWHPAVHDEVGQETLHYWFLTLSTSYDWDSLRTELLSLLESHHVYSFALYELMGDCDVLLRVWLPRGTSGSFRVSLREHLQRFGLSEEVLYSVEKVVRHWPFAKDGRGALKSLGREAANPDGALIEQVNERLREGQTADDAVLQPLAAEGVIGPMNHVCDQVPGVKIVTLIKPIDDMDFKRKDSLAKQIGLVLDEQDNIVQRSLYQVDGFRAAFLLTCLVPEHDFYAFRNELVGELAPFLQSAGARTNSYACASPDLLMFQDVIPPPNIRRKKVKPHPRRATDLLELDESDTLEVKGSALAPLDPWLFEGEDLAESLAFFHKGVLRAIVAFLNSDGGSVLIGALEPIRYRREPNKPMSGPEPELQAIGRYLGIGLVDPIYHKRGWDSYERNLAEQIASHVDPDPSSLVRIHNEEVEGITFGVIDVSPGGHDDIWHYLVPKKGGDADPQQFLVRQGARTVRLEGSEADRYKKLRK